MSDFILEYDMLESIAKYSKSLGKRSNEYGESLERKIIDAIENVTGTSSSYLTSASDSIRDKVSVLKQKSDAFYHFAEQITDLLEVAEQRDKEVADAIAAQKEYFLDHHESLRIDDWKSNLIELFVDIKNSIPFLDVLVDILDGLDIIFESLKDSIKHWYECEGGKYIVKAIGSVVVAVGAITLFVITLPASGFFAVCGAIGAGIGAVNAVTNVVTSFRAVDAATDGNPAWAVIYGKQDKLSDVLRQTNFGDGLLNDLSNMGARAIDKTETFFNYIGIAEIGLGLGKLLGGKAFKFIKNKESLNLSNLKNSAKNGIVDLKSNIKQGYTNFKTAIKGNTNAKSLLGDMPAEDLARYNKYWDDVAAGAYDVPYGMNADEYYQYLKGLDKVDDVARRGSYSNFAEGMSATDRARYIKSNESKFFDEFSERARSSGLDSKQISEAYDAMRAGDYNKMASYFDTSSPTNGAVFWSGNKVGAAAYADDIGGTIMEQTPGGQVFDDWRGLQGMFSEWDTGITPQKPIWIALSSQYAKGATGNVVYAVREGYVNPNSIWRTVEYPILKDLQDDGVITNIITEILRSK